jgi:hypothetical protein
MPTYAWTCAACAASCTPADERCEVCGCPATSTVAQQAAFRSAHLGSGPPARVRPRMHWRLTKSNFQFVIGVVVTVANLPIAYYVVYHLTGLQRALATAALLGIAWLFHRFVYKPLAARLSDGEA